MEFSRISVKLIAGQMFNVPVEAIYLHQKRSGKPRFSITVNSHRFIRDALSSAEGDTWEDALFFLQHKQRKLRERLCMTHKRHVEDFFWIAEKELNAGNEKQR